jgi:hypothetical protein
MCRKKEKKQNSVFDPITDILQFEWVMASPCNPGERRCKERQDKQRDMQPKLLLPDNFFQLPHSFKKWY